MLRVLHIFLFYELNSASFVTNLYIFKMISFLTGEVLYVSVNLQALSFAHRDNQVLVLDRCYAADTSENETPVYEFIRNG